MDLPSRSQRNTIRPDVANLDCSVFGHLTCFPTFLGQVTLLRPTWSAVNPSGSAHPQLSPPHRKSERKRSRVLAREVQLYSRTNTLLTILLDLPLPLFYFTTPWQPSPPNPGYLGWPAAQPIGPPPLPLLLHLPLPPHFLASLWRKFTRLLSFILLDYLNRHFNFTS